jgi:hypothetical protein
MFIVLTATIDDQDPPGEPPRKQRFNVHRIVCYGAIDAHLSKPGLASQVETSDLTWFAEESPEQIDRLIAEAANPMLSLQAPS